MGSRGFRTYSAPAPTPTAPYAAAPMQRSMTPNAPAAPYAAPYAAPGYGGGFGRSPFATGLLGGFLGAGIGAMMFGHHPFYGIGGIGSFFGFLIQILLLVLVVRWLLRLFLGRRPAFAGGFPGFARSVPGAAGPAGPRPMPAGGRPGPAVAIQRGDFQDFEHLLRDVQAAWTAADLNALRSLATPEMVGYFGEQLAELSSRGVRNSVSDLRLEQGDLSEAWSEGSREYATVAMRYTMIDVTRDQAGRVVDGSPTERTMVTELWTFLRAAGGRWVLSAIQQTS
jgi:predicted lipid-binding transport protein (Tim44 family)